MNDDWKRKISDADQEPSILYWIQSILALVCLLVLMYIGAVILFVAW